MWNGPFGPRLSTRLFLRVSSGDVAAADLDALAVEKVAQHPAARERVFQMQFIDAAHQREVLGRHRPRLVVDAGAADVQSLGLTDDGRGCGRSSLYAQHAGLDERAFQKIVLQRQLAYSDEAGQ